MTPVLLATMAHDPRRRWSMEDVAGVLALLADSSVPSATGSSRTPPVPESLPEPSQGTQQLRSVLPVPAAPPAEPTAVQPVQPAPPVTPPVAPPSRRRPVLPILVGLLVLALIGVIVALALSDDPQQSDPAVVQNPPSSATSSPTDAPTTDPPTTTAPTEAELEDFITGYLDTASNDPAAGFTQLTSAFQEASGGLDGYTGFWGSVSNPRVMSFSADPEALTVSYTYRYNVRGDGQREEQVSLQLVMDGDRLLIDGEA